MKMVKQCMVTGQWFYKRLKLFMIALVTLLTLPLQGALIATLQVDTVSQLEVWFEGHIDPPTGAGAPIGGAIVNTINWSFPSMHWDSYTGGTTFNVHVSTEHFVEPHPGDGPFGDPLTWTAPAQTFFQTMNVNHQTHTDHYTLTYYDGAISGLDDKWVFTGTHVPEPISIGLLAIGSLSVFRRRRK